MFVVSLYCTASESQWNIGQLETLTQEMGEEIERLQQTHPYVHSDDEDEGSVDPYSKYHHPPGTEVSSLSLCIVATKHKFGLLFRERFDCLQF